MKPALQVRLHQQLTLTPQLQQAIRLLQLSQLELEAELRQIAEGNPLLEFAEDREDAETESGADDHDGEEYSSDTSADDEPEDTGEWADRDGSVETPMDFSRVGSSSSPGVRGGEDFEPQNAAPATLQQNLLWQLNLAGFNPREQAIATVLIDALNPAGYLHGGLEAVLATLPVDFAPSVAEIEAVRRCVQGFDPIGVGSLDLPDCLRVQLERLRRGSGGGTRRPGCHAGPAMSASYTDDQLRRAVERLSDPEAFRDAERVIQKVAPDLRGVLVTALGEGGWFGQSHQSETLKAATMPDEEQRLEAIRALLSEETHMGMMVGVAVGWALRTELASTPESDSDKGES